MLASVTAAAAALAALATTLASLAAAAALALALAAAARPASLAALAAVAAATIAAGPLLRDHLRPLHNRSYRPELHSLAQLSVELRRQPGVLHHADRARP